MRRGDRFYSRTLGRASSRRYALIERSPGITAAELADALGVTRNRVWQIVRRLEGGRARRER